MAFHRKRLTTICWNSKLWSITVPRPCANESMVSSSKYLLLSLSPFLPQTSTANAQPLLQSTVLKHFGEEIDADAVCRKTCDYCIAPQRVAREIQASECMSTVANSHRLMHAGRNERNKGKKYHHNPLDEESLEGDYGSDDFLGNDEGLLGFTDYAPAGEREMATDRKKGFVKASVVLSKYEAKELEQGKKGGFVNFKTRTFDEPTQEDLDAKRYRAVSVPEHLKKAMPDPLARHSKVTKEAGLKKSSSYASEAERLQAELAELEKQKAAALAQMGGSLKSLSSRRTSKSLPPPPLTFKRRRPR